MPPGDQQGPCAYSTAGPGDRALDGGSATKETGEQQEAAVLVSGAPLSRGLS